MSTYNKEERAKIRAYRLLYVAMPLFSFAIILICIPFLIAKYETFHKKIKEDSVNVKVYCDDYVKTLMKNYEIERRGIPIVSKQNNSTNMGVRYSGSYAGVIQYTTNSYFDKKSNDEVSRYEFICNIEMFPDGTYRIGPGFDMIERFPDGTYQRLRFKEK